MGILQLSLETIAQSPASHATAQMQARFPARCLERLIVSVRTVLIIILRRLRHCITLWGSASSVIKE